MLETTANRELVRRLNDIPRCKFILTQGGIKRGDPDIIGCVVGIMVCAEIKRKKPTELSKGHALQRMELRDWSEAGAISLVVNGLSAIPAFEGWVRMMAQDRIETELQDDGYMDILNRSARSHMLGKKNQVPPLEIVESFRNSL